MEPSPGPSTEKKDKMDLEEELTNKFLSGEMSFAEYSSEWYGCDEEEEEQEDDSVVDTIQSNEPQLALQFVDKFPKNKKFTRLSTALLGLMGEANLRFVRGEKEMAEKMCHEIIKQVPTAPEPYQTLAQIYEHDAERSLQFSLLAAHLSPSDANEWLRLASISRERNDFRQEMICYSHAIKADPENLSTHLKRLEVLTKLEELKVPLSSLNINRVKCYQKIVNSLPSSQPELIIKYAKMAATLYHNTNELERALEVMASAYRKCASTFTLEDINIFMELLIACKQFQTCLEIFVENMGVEIEAEIQTVKNQDGKIEEQTNYINCSIPQNLPIDLRSKLLVSFIYLGAINLVQNLLKDFLTNDVEKAGDLFMDLEEALSAVNQHEMALQLLEPLVKTPSYNLGAVWLKHGECLYNLGRIDEAINSYYKVINHAPQHAGARRKLFEILESKGRIEEALDVLQQNYKYVVSASIMQEHLCALKKYNSELKYLEVGEALLSRTFVKYRHQEEISIARKLKAGIDHIHNFRDVRGESRYNEDDLQFDTEPFNLTPQQEWDLFTELLHIACKNKQYFAMQRLSFGALVPRSISPHRQQIEFYCLQACLLSKDHQNAFRFIRDLVVKYPKSTTWNLLNLITNSLDDNNLGKYFLRLFQKENHIVKNLFLGNNFLTSGRYIVALKCFLQFHEDQSRDPLSALLIAITILIMAAQRTVDKHHNLVLQGMSYLFTYQKLRKCDQESYYNIGRAYQMLNISNLAIEYYEKALACAPIAHCDLHGTIDLTRETAYNLYILYKDHSPQMASKYILKYLVI